MRADKFLNLLTTWDKYLAPSYLSLSPLSAAATMRAVGVVEIIAGLVVALKPRIGAYVVAAWLAGIILDLLLVGGYYDVALRDFGLFLGALALGRLSETTTAEDRSGPPESRSCLNYHVQTRARLLRRVQPRASLSRSRWNGAHQRLGLS